MESPQEPGPDRHHGRGSHRWATGWRTGQMGSAKARTPAPEASLHGAQLKTPASTRGQRQKRQPQSRAWEGSHPHKRRPWRLWRSQVGRRPAPALGAMLMFTAPPQRGVHGRSGFGPARLRMRTLQKKSKQHSRGRTSGGSGRSRDTAPERATPDLCSPCRPESRGHAQGLESSRRLHLGSNHSCVSARALGEESCLSPPLPRRAGVCGSREGYSTDARRGTCPTGRGCARTQPQSTAWTPQAGVLFMERKVTLAGRVAPACPLDSGSAHPGDPTSRRLGRWHLHRQGPGGQSRQHPPC